MAKLVFVVLALCLVQASVARVTRDAPAETPAEENTFLKSLTEFGQKFQSALADTQQNVLKALGFQSNEEVVETIQKNTGKYVEQLKTIQATIQQEAAKNSHIFDPIVQDLNAQIEETRKKLSEQNPELVQKAKEYQESVQTNFQSLATEAQKAGERLKEQSQGASEQLQAAFKQLYDVTFQAVQNTNKELQGTKA